MNKKIFIIEDDSNIIFSLEAKLRIEGYLVEINQGTVSLDDIISNIKNYKPDYIILDIILPKVDGFDVVKKLKGDIETSNIPIFIFTNLSDNDSREKALKLGVDYYILKKDIALDDFVIKFKKIIDNKEKEL